MKLSVLVPTYRRPDDLRRCLAALANQTRWPDQVVVVVRDIDPASREAAEKAAIALTALPLEVETVRIPGIIAALNAGLPALSGDVFCFTDDGGEPLPDWLERIEAHYRDPDVVGVGGRDIVVRHPETIHQTCSVVGRGSWYGRFVGNHHLALEPSRPVTVDVLKGVNMSFQASAVTGFRFDEAFAAQSNTCTEMDICFVARKKWRPTRLRPGDPGPAPRERPGRTARPRGRASILRLLAQPHLRAVEALELVATTHLSGLSLSDRPAGLMGTRHLG